MLRRRFVTRIVLLVPSLLAIAGIAAQAAAQADVQAGAPARDTAWINRSTNPLLASFRFRPIGPASMGGRIDDIEAAPSDPSIIYVGYATGGVFRTTNNATTFEAVFETYGSASIGDIAIDPKDPNVVYVGTGEANNRQTSTFGDGVYKTIDGGRTFTNIGLRETQTIARIVIDPRNPQIVYVASPGHLFGPNPERGLYKTTDGGKSWNKIKYIDENTGFTDIAIDPSNTNILYAASYQRRRSGCCYNGGGPGSALWKSDDAGRTWTKLTSGLPTGTLGRIAIGVSASNPNVVYAQIEAEAAGAAETPAPGAGAGGGGAGGGRGAAFDWCNNGGPTHGFPAAGGRGASVSETSRESSRDTTRTPPALDASRSGVFRSDDRGRSWHVVSNCDGRPLYFSQLRVDPSNENTIYIANVHPARSLDGGKTFLTLDAAGGFFNMGEDQHALWIDPHNPRHILRGNDAGLAISWDQGATWEYVRTMNTGLAYWVTADMGHPYYVYTGLQDNDSWGGPSATRSRIGIPNSDWFHLTGGDGFQTAVDPTDFHIIYSEQQDGNVSRTDLRTGRSQSIRPVAPPREGGAGRGGRRGGSPAQGALTQSTSTQGATTRDTASQSTATDSARTCVDGRLVASSGRGGRGGGATAGGGVAQAGFGRGRDVAHPNVLNARPGDTYRFNWNTPLLLSPNNPNIVWLGGNRLFKSYDRGETWVASADLSKQVDRCTIALMGVPGTEAQLSKNDGVTAFGTITAIAESPVLPGVVWAGTDDGSLQLSRDGGATFTEVGRNLRRLPANALTGPNPYWISRIEASHFDSATAYIAIDGHRADDLRPYVFVTHDFGRTFQSIAGNLPAAGDVQVIREDPNNRSLLYAGTEFGLFITLDGGAHWEPFMNDYPTVRTDDILVHPRDGDLIVATHGRSLWIADDITPLRQLTPALLAEDVALFDVRPAIAYLFDFRTDVDEGGDHRYAAANPARGTAISYYLKSPASGPVTVSIVDAAGRTLCTSSAPATAGIHRVQWTLVSPLVAPPGGAAAESNGGRASASAPDRTCDGSGRPGGRGGQAAAVPPGTYVAKLSVAGHDYTTPVRVLEDVWLHER